jgi:hypothetical protein
MKEMNGRSAMGGMLASRGNPHRSSTVSR